MCVHGAAAMAALMVSGVCCVCVHGAAGMAALIVSYVYLSFLAPSLQLFLLF